jgi:hypothetical protein
MSENIFTCTCAQTAPTMPTARSTHLQDCPMFWYEYIRSLEMRVIELEGHDRKA